MDITPEEQRQLKTIIDTAEKYRRSNEKREKARRNAGKASRDEYLTQQEQATQNRIQAVQAVIKEHPHLTQREIAQALGISIPRLKQLKRKLSDK